MTPPKPFKHEDNPKFVALTPRQRLFVAHYLEHSHKKNAAIYAGYKPHNAPTQAHRLLNNVKVQEYINEVMANRERAQEVTAEWIVSKLKFVADTCSSQCDVVDKEGNVIGQRMTDPAGANKALELLGKVRSIKLFSDVTEVDNPADKISDAELDKRIKAILAEKEMKETAKIAEVVPLKAANDNG